MSEITLESADYSFQQWRSQRSSRTEPIPEKLWSMAIDLYPRHKRSHICRRLGLSGSQFKQRLEDVDAGFVLASTDMDTPSPKPASEVTLKLQGQRLALTLKVSIDSLSQVLPHFEGLL